MVKRKIIATGFSGSGVMSMGKLLSFAGMNEDKNIIWLPNYGKKSSMQVRFCLVISNNHLECENKEVTDIIILSGDNFEDLEGKLAKGGNLFINKSLVKYTPKRKDINVYLVPASELARKIGNPKVANMVMLGAYLEITQLLNFGTLIQAFTKVYGYNLRKVLPLYQKAVVTGAGSVRNARINGFEEDEEDDEVKSHKILINEEEIDLNNLNSEAIQERLEITEDFENLEESSREDKIFMDDISIVHKAYENEETMVRFYIKSRQILKGNIASQVFGSLAKQSYEHLLYLQSLIKELKGEPIVVLNMEETSVEEEKINWKEMTSENRIFALSIFVEAIKLKNSSIDFYKKAIERAKSEDAKRLYRELEYWENYQLEQLQSQYDFLKEESNWNIL